MDGVQSLTHGVMGAARALYVWELGGGGRVSSAHYVRPSVPLRDADTACPSLCPVPQTAGRLTDRYYCYRSFMERRRRLSAAQQD